MKYISAEAFAAEMKIRQDVAKEWLIEATGTDDFDSKARAEAVLSFLCEVKLTLDSIPAADVREVVRGEWIRRLDTRFGPKLNDIIICSNCNIAFSTENMIRRSFCPNCGARMDGKAE